VNPTPDELQRILKRLRKILALANSSDAGEAAAALHQARTIMDKYNIDAIDAEATIVEEYDAKASGAKIQRWEIQLIIVVKRAMGVEAVIGHHEKMRDRVRPRGTITFIGEGKRAGIAGYAFEVLRRKLKASMQAVIDEAMAGAAKRHPEWGTDLPKIRVTPRERDAYVGAWCHAVKQKISALLAAPPPASVQRHMDTMGLQDAQPEKPSRPSKKPLSGFEIFMVQKGHEDGKNSELYQAMDSGVEQRARICEQ